MNKSMTKINLPKDLLQKETFKSLPAKEKDEYLNNFLLKIINLNPDGITISQIKEATGLTYSTIWHHMELLCSTAQCYKVSRGNLDVYFSSGSVNHLNDYSKNKRLYTISTIKNSEGAFVCIHEKEVDRSGNQAVCSGVSIPLELVDDLIKTLSKAKQFKGK